MNIGIFGGNFLKALMNSLEKEGHTITYNQFSTDFDVLINESHFYIYQIYKILKKLKRSHIKLVNVILDIPPWRLLKNFSDNSNRKYIKQTFYDIIKKSYFFNEQIEKILHKQEKNIIEANFAKIYQKYFTRFYLNRIFYQFNYRSFLKHSDLNLSISKFTQKSLEKFLKVKSEVWYPGVNSDVLLSMPRPTEIKYDAINISRISKNKRQEIFIKAANKLGLKILVIGEYLDKYFSQI